MTQSKPAYSSYWHDRQGLQINVLCPRYQPINEVPLPCKRDSKGMIGSLMKCFNCGNADHRLSDCKVRRNRNCIGMNKTWMQSYARIGVKQSRKPAFHQRYFINKNEKDPLMGKKEKTEPPPKGFCDLEIIATPDDAKALPAPRPSPHLAPHTRDFNNGRNPHHQNRHNNNHHDRRREPAPRHHMQQHHQGPPRGNWGPPPMRHNSHPGDHRGYGNQRGYNDRGYHHQPQRHHEPLGPPPMARQRSAPLPRNGHDMRPVEMRRSYSATRNG